MAIAYFYSNDNKTKISMDAETSLTYSQTNTSTKSSMMSGAPASDGYTIGNKTVTLEGLVTSSKTPYQESNNLSPDDFRKYIEETIQKRTRFTVNFDFPENGTRLLDSVSNCIITNIRYVIDKYEDTMTVSLTFEEQFISPAATETVLTPKQSAAAAKSYSTTGDAKDGVKKDNSAAEDTTAKSALYNLSTNLADATGNLQE